MKEVEFDVNFTFLIIMLAIVLLAAIAGARINAYQFGVGAPAQTIVLIAFLILSMALLALAMLFPYLTFWVGNGATVIGLLKLFSQLYFYQYAREALLGIGTGMVIGETISTLLIIVGGVILILNRR
ncbi:hypothetical protein JXB02_02525 [Candidatus Woesearchaeota archaeon]|nr:hypothetical protein [Candidatus Woesearchaeota archaeon]